MDATADVTPNASKCCNPEHLFTQGAHNQRSPYLTGVGHRAAPHITPTIKVLVDGMSTTINS